MKSYIYVTILILSSLCTKGYTQNSTDTILANIEVNNSTLKAYREQVSAEKIGNRIGLTIPNPEIDFAYLWGSPKDAVSHRTNLDITQSFDFPTAYRYKSQLAGEKDKQIDLGYDKQRREVFEQARLLCVELIYQTKVNNAVSQRLKYAKELSEAYQKKFEYGDIDILERNRTHLNYLNLEKDKQINDVEINTLRQELERLNGGIPIEITPNRYPEYSIPSNFKEWFNRIKDNNPTINMVKQEIALSRKQEQLTRALNLPKITAGYTSERVPGETLQGVKVGVSIPLWGNKNTVKYQKAQTIALQMQYQDTELQSENILLNHYQKASKLFVLLNEYQKVLDTTNNRDLLKKALDKGQLSLINYLLELSSYYETIDKYIQIERDYQLAISSLIQWEN